MYYCRRMAYLFSMPAVVHKHYMHKQSLILDKKEKGGTAPRTLLNHQLSRRLRMKNTHALRMWLLWLVALWASSLVSRLSRTREQKSQE